VQTRMRWRGNTTPLRPMLPVSQRLFLGHSRSISRFPVAAVYGAFQSSAQLFKAADGSETLRNTGTLVGVGLVFPRSPVPAWLHCGRQAGSPTRRPQWRARLLLRSALEERRELHEVPDKE
jgi:hypothetical protein